MSKKICMKCLGSFAPAAGDRIDICPNCLLTPVPKPMIVEKSVTIELKKPDLNLSPEPEMKNHLMDLNNHLFEQLERLNDTEITEEMLTREIKRSNAITTVAQTIINNANMVINAQVAMKRHSINPNSIKMIEAESV